MSLLASSLRIWLQIKHILEKYGKSWNELKGVAREGDQVWMWRGMFGGWHQYAHVALYMDSDSMVHVGPKSKTFIDQYLAYSAQIWEEKVDEVVKNSNCLLIRCQPKNIVGTIRLYCFECIYFYIGCVGTYNHTIIYSKL